MALTGPGLAAARKAALEGAQGTPPVDPVAFAKFVDADSQAIVDYITANAAVVVASVSGVTAGGSSSGPGTGTVT